MKTVYIPKGETVTYQDLTTERLVVEGCLKVSCDIKARTICGSGFIEAERISADDIRADDVEAVCVTCRRLIAKRVESAELFASESAAVSSFLGGDRVVTPRLSVALSDIDEVVADEVINLRQRKRGLFRFLLASSLRAWWMRFTAPKDVIDADYEPAGKKHITIVNLEKKKEDRHAA